MYYILLIFSILTDPLAGLAGDLTHGQFLVVKILSPNNLIIYLKKIHPLFPYRATWEIFYRLEASLRYIYHPTPAFKKKKF